VGLICWPPLSVHAKNAPKSPGARLATRVSRRAVVAQRLGRASPRANRRQQPRTHPARSPGPYLDAVAPGPACCPLPVAAQHNG
jgi:hypothetical protein